MTVIASIPIRLQANVSLNMLYIYIYKRCHLYIKFINEQHQTNDLIDAIHIQTNANSVKQNKEN